MIPLGTKKYLGDPKIPEVSCCKYMGISVGSDLSWTDQVNYAVQNHVGHYVS